MKRGRAAWLAVVFAACASPPPADATLRAHDAGASGALDAQAEQALQRADATPADAELQLAAAQTLFVAAEWRLQRATCDWLAAHADAALAEVLAADDRVDDAVRQAVASLCTRGLQCAERAAASRPDDVRVLLLTAQHRSLLAWAVGPARAVLAGHGPKLAKAVEAAVARDERHDGAAPLRLLGRFRAQAPWPYGDLPAALQALQKAVDAAPLVVNHVFYGDALAKDGQLEAARAQWSAAVGAAVDASTAASADLLREQARARLAAAAR